MSGHPIVPIRTYVFVFLGLLIGTGLTYAAAIQDFGFLNVIVALGIAVMKASLVVWFFMGVRFSTPLTKVVAISGFLWMLILFGIGMSDYLSRPWLGVPGR